MKIKMKSLQFENLTKFTFFAPKWWASLLYILAISAIIDIICYFTLGYRGFGIAFAFPAFFAFVTTKPLASLLGKQVFTWNRSGLMALAGVLFSGVMVFLAFIPNIGLQLAYIFGVGFVLFVRLIVLVAVVDYRIPRMILPALMPTLASIPCAFWFFGLDITAPLLVSIIFFGLAALVYLAIFDKPLRKGAGLSGMQFVNVYLGNLTNGTHDMEDYLREISSPSTVPETTFFFHREGKKDVWFVVPNLHPGPMADIGGSNFPTLIYKHFEAEATVLVSHGCASHDLNMISNSETEKIIDAIQKSRTKDKGLSIASRPVRSSYGTVSCLSQRFGDSILIVTTRSPLVTEDMDYSIGRIVMGEGKSLYKNIGFVDAHNRVEKNGKITYPSTKNGNEYISAASDAMDAMKKEEMHPFSVGACRQALPFTTKEGFGETGLVVMIVATDNTKTAYVLFDGNNVQPGVREVLREHLMKKGYNECEIMTTDTHIVNFKSGMNPVGMVIPPEKIIPYLDEALEKAEADLSQSTVTSATELCENVQVFGPGKITQLVALVSGVTACLFPYFLLFTMVGFFFIFTICLIVL